jgi:leucyl/phenylalanyl-tRNA---protein transferase
VSRPAGRFPDPRLSKDPDGVIAVGGEFSTDLLFEAYSKGIFPWPIDGMLELPWFSPDPRAILEFDRLHISKSLSRTLNAAKFKFTVDEHFDDVIDHCAKVPRRGQHGTWITDELLDGYLDLHRQGYAHSVEVWDDSENLVGGIYGVSVLGTFSAESMFHLKTGASKAALMFLMAWLRDRGLSWIDIQQMTPHLEKMGARSIPRVEFLRLLETTQKMGNTLF